MPIKQTPQVTTECGFSEWSVRDGKRKTLVNALAYLYLSQEENAERVIDDLEPKRRVPRGRVADNVVAKLSGPRRADIDLAKNGTAEEKEAAQNRIDVAISHRDGLLFQHISWIVARREIPNGVMPAPHVRAADKGFDGFIIEVSKDTGAVERIIICEDKASVKPRPLISSSVWPDIASIILGNRDDEILAELTALLKTVPGLDTGESVDKVFWEEAKQFRVSVATGENRRKAGSFVHIIEGFEEIAGGAVEGRVAGVLPFADLRKGLAEIAEEVITEVQEISRV